VWLLGSSLYSAQLAAQLGLPFAFASHFAPDMLFQALHLYRSNFKPSARLEKPYAMVCINIIAADSNRDAEFLFTSMQQAFVKLRRGETGAAAAGGKYASAVVSVRAVWRSRR
jgi:alkanesulfonate monooxygenase SsuD/methylene tetrahydromethanopterin reductase-like flavin-dependent oxidoreductase (luciferase family)